MPETVDHDITAAGMLDALSGVQRQRFRDVLAEKALREFDALSIYEPQPNQEAFHRSTATYRIVRGGWRSGKSLCGYVEVARAALGKDPYQKYPTDHPLRIWIIVYDESQIGRTVYRMLFRADAFDMIRDAVTGKWRTYRPWDAEDAARAGERRRAPPLIPPRFIKPDGWAWKSKGERIFSRCELINGVEIYAFTSGSEAPTGDPVDVVEIDEDIKNASYLPELQARLSDRKGRLIWTSTPRYKNNALISLYKRAEASRDDPSADVQAFRLNFLENVYIDEDEKRKRLADWTDEQARKAYIYGEYSFDDVLMYPAFHREIHGVPAIGTVADKLDDVLRWNVVPADWTRYLILDPGYTIFAGLFAAVPPPALGEAVVAYDELYLPNCDLVRFSAALKQKCFGQSFHAFLIDDHGSRVHAPLAVKSYREQIVDVFRSLGLSSAATGHDFFLGSDDVEARTSAVRGWLVPRECGTPRFRVLVNLCPNLCNEFGDYYRKTIDGMVTDRPRDRSNHLMNCLEYLAAYRPKYHPPRPGKANWSPAYSSYMEMIEEKKNRRGGSWIDLGAAAGAGQPAFSHF